MNYKCILVAAAMGIVTPLPGCGIIPLWASVAHTVGDAALSLKTGKSSSEHGLSILTGKDCQFIRVIDKDADVCMSQEEYADYLLSLDCDVYAWGVLGRVYCAEGT